MRQKNRNNKFWPITHPKLSVGAIISVNEWREVCTAHTSDVICVESSVITLPNGRIKLLKDREARRSSCTWWADQLGACALIGTSVSLLCPVPNYRDTLLSRCRRCSGLWFYKLSRILWFSKGAHFVHSAIICSTAESFEYTCTYLFSVSEIVGTVLCLFWLSCEYVINEHYAFRSFSENT